jgi:hypothetical protein
LTSLSRRVIAAWKVNADPEHQIPRIFKIIQSTSLLIPMPSFEVVGNKVHRDSECFFLLQLTLLQYIIGYYFDWEKMKEPFSNAENFGDIRF